MSKRIEFIKNDISRLGDNIAAKEKQQDEEKKKLFVAIDGNRVPDGIGSSSDGGGGGGDDGGVSVTAEVLVKGDGRVFSVAAASILAKLTRDQIMVEHDAEFSECGLKLQGPQEG